MLEIRGKLYRNRAAYYAGREYTLRESSLPETTQLQLCCIDALITEARLDIEAGEPHAALAKLEDATGRMEGEREISLVLLRGRQRVDAHVKQMLGTL